MFEWLTRWLKNWQEFKNYEWRRVPKPNWRCARGHSDIW